METSKHYDRVKSFMVLANQQCPERPELPPEDVRKMRASLILEEALETVKALGFTVLVGEKLEQSVKMENITFMADQEPDLVEIADGCADISVVTVGTLIACGIKDKTLIEVVDNNNLAKFGPGHSFRSDGKLIKPPGHTKPDIKKIIEEHYNDE